MNYEKIINEYVSQSYKRMLSPAIGDFKFPCLLPVAGYSHELWDWGSWLSDVAIRQIMADNGAENGLDEYEKGCVLNFLDFAKPDGSIPLVIPTDKKYDISHFSPDGNIHKPVIAQHTAFIVKYTNDAEWIRNGLCKIEYFLEFYENNCKHESGLFYFIDDFAIGVDNDPCTFFRPRNSSASIFLNCLMYKELKAMEYICERLGYHDKQKKYCMKAEELKRAINDNCWDKKDGFYYSCDLNLLPIAKDKELHSGCPRHWNNLIQRIGVWSGFMAMWAGVAEEEQAERMVKENLLDEKSFNAAYGVRTLSKYEKMYRIVKSGNPSCWLGPVWGISNYMVFRGLVSYGYADEAKKLAKKTIQMFGKDVEQSGAFHEYYDPETGEGVYNRDFLSWNLLIANMIAWYEGKKVITEF